MAGAAPARIAPERVYRGERTADGGWAVWVEEGGCRRPLPHVVYHAPDSFSWGYGGSGPADCALSILADALGEPPTRDVLDRGAADCWRWHQAFKRDVIDRLDQDAGFQLTLAAVEAWIARRRAEEDDRG
jgi:hypothetical protein